MTHPPANPASEVAKRLSVQQRLMMRFVPDHCGSHPYRHGISWGTAKSMARLGLGEAIQVDRWFKPNDLYRALKAHLLTQAQAQAQAPAPTCNDSVQVVGAGQEEMNDG